MLSMPSATHIFLQEQQSSTGTYTTLCLLATVSLDVFCSEDLEVKSVGYFVGVKKSNQYFFNQVAGLLMSYISTLVCEWLTSIVSV